MMKRSLSTALIFLAMASPAFATGSDSLCDKFPDSAMCTGSTDWENTQNPVVNDSAEDLIQFGLATVSQAIHQTLGDPQCDQSNTDIQCTFKTAAAQTCQMTIRTSAASYGFNVLCRAPRKRARRLTFRKSRRFEN